jgi:GST-like protein
LGDDAVIDLHYIATANGLKIGFLLEELGLDYRVIPYEMFAGEHLSPDFRRLNPNHKLPVIVDHAPSDGAGPLTVFETGAIMLYLADKAGRLIPRDLRRRSLAQQWLIWQVSGLGPMHGQAHHFIRYAPEGQTYAVERYTKEARRQLNVLEYRLREAEYLAEEFSIADLAVFPWVQGAHLIGFDLEQFPAIAGWCMKVLQRPAVQKTLGIPELKVPAHYVRERAGLNAEEWSNLFGDRMHAATELHAISKS